MTSGRWSRGNGDARYITTSFLSFFSPPSAHSNQMTARLPEHRLGTDANSPRVTCALSHEKGKSLFLIGRILSGLRKIRLH